MTAFFWLKTVSLFFVTALAEITGCFLPWYWLKKGSSPWLSCPRRFPWPSSPGS